jgi:hypothetical protein
MAALPLSGDPRPFKISDGLAPLRAKDAQFWLALAAWRAAEDDFLSWPGYPDECAKAAELLALAAAKRRAMFGIRVKTASALLVKFEALRELGAAGLIDSELSGGFTIGDLIQFDLERLSTAEIFTCPAEDDLGNG